MREVEKEEGWRWVVGWGRKSYHNNYLLSLSLCVQEREHSIFMMVILRTVYDAIKWLVLTSWTWLRTRWKRLNKRKEELSREERFEGRDSYYLLVPFTFLDNIRLTWWPVVKIGGWTPWVEWASEFEDIWECIEGGKCRLARVLEVDGCIEERLDARFMKSLSILWLKVSDEAMSDPSSTLWLLSPSSSFHFIGSQPPDSSTLFLKNKWATASMQTHITQFNS